MPGGAQELLGATPEALRARLGEPRLVRNEDGAQVWHYQAQHCHLDLVLYAEGRSWRVAWAQARASGAERRSEAACLREIGGQAQAGTGPVA